MLGLDRRYDVEWLLVIMLSLQCALVTQNRNINLSVAFFSIKSFGSRQAA